MAETPTEVARSIGEEYVESCPKVGPVVPTTRAFEVMAEVNAELFSDIPIPVRFTSDDPYADYPEMRDRVRDERVLWVFDGGEDHPIWDHKQEVQSRAVHDWYGHLALNVDFSPSGEYLKWKHARNHYPAYCDRYLFTEVVGQLGAVYYLDDGFADPRFEQKVFPAPMDWIERMSRAVEGE